MRTFYIYICMSFRIDFAKDEAHRQAKIFFFLT